MDPQEIQPWDWQRILLGEVPLGFLLEAIMRIGFIYVLLIISMRMIGKKMASQFTRNEMAALVSLAAAVGVPILSPDRGLLPALVICVAVVAMSRLVLRFSMRNEKNESLVLGATETLIEDGILKIKTMESTGITKERIFAQLRSQQLLHLGQVNKLFFEANGQFTLVKSLDHRPGLTIIPGEDSDFTTQLSKSQALACNVCGQVTSPENTNTPCPTCGHRTWTEAVESEEKTPDKVPAGQQ